jgi:hypothetical protein
MKGLARGGCVQNDIAVFCSLTRWPCATCPGYAKTLCAVCAVWLMECYYVVEITSSSNSVAVQKGRPCVPLRIQGIYTVTNSNIGSGGTSYPHGFVSQGRSTCLNNPFRFRPHQPTSRAPVSRSHPSIQPSLPVPSFEPLWPILDCITQYAWNLNHT